MDKPYLFLLSLVLTALLTSTPVDGDDKRCVSYCDVNEVKTAAFYCNESLYCCGTINDRYCCPNKTLDISDKYKDVLYCRSSAWFMYSWQVLLGTMGIMVMLIVLAACCCQCCNLKRGGWRDATRARGSRRRQHRSDTELSTISVPDEPQPSFFDPSHPYAFTPPDYESLAKDPPAYSSLFGGGSSNPGFEGDERGVTSGGGLPVVATVPEGPPPAYKEHNDTSTEQQQQQPAQAQAQLPPPQSPGQSTSSSPQTESGSAPQTSSQGSSTCPGRPDTNTTAASPGGQSQGREERVRHGSVEDRPHPPVVPDVNQPEHSQSQAVGSSTTPTTSQNGTASNGRGSDSRNVVNIQVANDNVVNI